MRRETRHDAPSSAFRLHRKPTLKRLLASVKQVFGYPSGNTFADGAAALAALGFHNEFAAHIKRSVET